MGLNGVLVGDAGGAPLVAVVGATVVRPALVTQWVGRALNLRQEPGLRPGAGFGGLSTLETRAS